MDLFEWFYTITGLSPYGDRVTTILFSIMTLLIVYDVIHILFSGVTSFISKK